MGSLKLGPYNEYVHISDTIPTGYSGMTVQTWQIDYTWRPSLGQTPSQLPVVQLPTGTTSTGGANPNPPAPPSQLPRTILNTIVEGVRVAEEEARVFSTGELFPEIVTGWDHSDRARTPDGQMATTGNDQRVLVAEKFNAQIPPGSTIAGIIVRVVRWASRDLTSTTPLDRCRIRLHQYPQPQPEGITFFGMSPVTPSPSVGEPGHGYFSDDGLTIKHIYDNDGWYTGIRTTALEIPWDVTSAMSVLNVEALHGDYSGRSFARLLYKTETRAIYSIHLWGSGRLLVHELPREDYDTSFLVEALLYCISSPTGQYLFDISDASTTMMLNRRDFGFGFDEYEAHADEYGQLAVPDIDQQLDLLDFFGRSEQPHPWLSQSADGGAVVLTKGLSVTPSGDMFALYEWGECAERNINFQRINVIKLAIPWDLTSASEYMSEEFVWEGSFMWYGNAASPYIKNNILLVKYEKSDTTGFFTFIVNV